MVPQNDWHNFTPDYNWGQIMQYKVITTYSGRGYEEAIKRLEEMVNEHIKQGWVPKGGISISTSYSTCAQAIIKN
jgi:hypothetical protein